MLDYQVNSFLEAIEGDPKFSTCISYRETNPSRIPNYVEWPGDVHPTLMNALKNNGIKQLYHHQFLAWDLVTKGRNLVIATGTASGKTICYNLPVLNRLLVSGHTGALYIFPTKALANDQKDELQNLTDSLHPHPVIETYDGDTPANRRRMIRENAQILITNPDMLHTGILPHHTNWARFFTELQFIILDEVHTYRGIFGSHVCNLLRRVKRISSFYGSFPKFILTSATIGNPVEHAEKLIEEDVEIINQDGSGKGQKHFLVINPPVLDENLGIRKSAFSQCMDLACDLVKADIQTVVFGRSRKTVEQFVREAKLHLPTRSEEIRGYRSGYLPKDRRKIESDLRNGQARLVVATNALELGIDIGGLSTVLLMGYPGSVAATRQQAGRAGRKEESALAIFVASSGPIDQFLARHPDFLVKRSPENALINPDNFLILLSHIRCAGFELPFQPGERFGKLDPDLLKEFLQYLVSEGTLVEKGGIFFWMADQYPASAISLRNASADVIALQVEKNGNLRLIGQVDYSSSLWMVHPGAVYLHEGDSYEVASLDLERKNAILRQSQTDFYTEPLNSLIFSKISEGEKTSAALHDTVFGEILVTSQVKGFQRLLWGSRQILDESPLDLPPSELRTTASWWVVLPEAITKLEQQNLWRNSPNDYGPGWDRIRHLVLQRDKMTCQVCGKTGSPGNGLHVHHIQPFKTFSNRQEANRLENLVTLCPTCHHKAETAVKLQSGMAGLTFSLQQIASLFVMCDPMDLGASYDPQSALAEKQPAIILYDQVPAGIGLSRKIFELAHEILTYVRELIFTCPCVDGCPSCIGPAGENGLGAKQETLALINCLLE